MVQYVLVRGPLLNDEIGALHRRVVMLALIEVVSDFRPVVDLTVLVSHIVDDHLHILGRATVLSVLLHLLLSLGIGTADLFNTGILVLRLDRSQRQYTQE